MRSNQPVLALVAAALLAACGADEPTAAGAGDGVASLQSGDHATAESSDDTADASDELEAPEDIEDAMTLFQDCMEDHGVEGGGMFVIASGAASPDGEAIEVNGNQANDDAGPPPSLEDVDPEVFRAADEACRGHLANAAPEFELSPEQEAAMEDAQLEFSKCMEEHGIDAPMFSSSVGGGDSIGISDRLETSSIDEQLDPDDFDPGQFNAAAEECQSVYDEYPELKDLFGPGGAPTMAVHEAEAP
jgi:hypothetical protein